MTWSLLLVATKFRSALAAAILFLRKQPAMFQERNARPHHGEHSARWLMARVSRMFDWRSALLVVKPDTLIRWHRQGFRLFRRWKSKRAGDLLFPKNLQEFDPDDGRLRIPLGRGAYRQRVEIEAGNPGGTFYEPHLKRLVLRGALLIGLRTTANRHQPFERN